MMPKGGHLKASVRYFHSEGPYSISSKGNFYTVKGVIYMDVTEEGPDGEPVTRVDQTTKVTKNRWVKIVYPHRHRILQVHSYCLAINPSPELLAHGQVRSPGIIEKDEPLAIYFRPDANMDLDDLDEHMRVLIMEAVG